MRGVNLLYTLGLAGAWLMGWACEPLEQRVHPQWRGVSQVYILPASDADTATLHYLARHVADSVGAPVQVLPAVHLPSWAWYAPRKRYWADSLLKWMAHMAQQDGERWLLVTTADISTTRKAHFNWGVMGLAYQPGRVAVVSDYRLQEYGRSAGDIQAALLKIALHELGHSSGLGHCAQGHCLMQDADGTNKTGKLTGFCNTCRKRLFGP